MSREQADCIAHQHYSHFEERRRTATELEAEAALNRQLQDPAEKAPPLPRKPD